MVRSNSRFLKLHVLGAGALIGGLLLVSGCGCTNCNLRSEHPDKAPMPATAQSVTGLYEVISLIEDFEGCEGTPLSTAPSYLRVAFEGEGEGPGVVYALCEDASQCGAAQPLEYRFGWHDGQGLGRIVTSSASVDRTHRFENVCEMVLYESLFEPTGKGEVRISHRTYRGSVALEGDEPCSPEFVMERKAALECVTLREITGTRKK